jgi:glyoxylase-like metal-dependent hydrolase (beta-lactamase superfamily II)
MTDLSTSRRALLQASLAAGAVAAAGASGAIRAPRAAQRLYVFDCGTLLIGDMTRFSLSREEVQQADLAVACFLVVHAKGALLWDVGAVPDADWQPTGSVVRYHLVLADGNTRDLDLRKRLSSQLAEIGYAPDQITFLALSHYHYDHTANANSYVNSTWLVAQSERDAMFATALPPTTQPSSYDKLKNAKTILIKTDEYDVFGDGSVVIKAAVGHTPGHRVLIVHLSQSGTIVLSGDLYHYPEERVLGRVPTFEFDAAQTLKSRAEIERYIRAQHAKLIIQHDIVGNATLIKSPQFFQ